MFKVGDIVICTDARIAPPEPRVVPEKWRGRIIDYPNGYASRYYMVEFERDVRGHNADGRGQPGRCWNIHLNYLRLAERPFHLKLAEPFTNVDDAIAAAEDIAKQINLPVKVLNAIQGG